MRHLLALYNGPASGTCREKQGGQVVIYGEQCWQETASCQWSVLSSCGEAPCGEKPSASEE